MLRKLAAAEAEADYHHAVPAAAAARGEIVHEIQARSRLDRAVGAVGCACARRVLK